MEEITPMSSERRRTEKKLLQTKVIRGKGEADFFLEADFDFSGNPFFKIESVDTWVDVYDVNVIKGNKVIFNAWVYKNIIYKTSTQVGQIDGIVTVNGGIEHITQRIPLAGYIDIKIKDKECINPEEDIAEVIDAYVIDDVEENLIPEAITNAENQLLIPPLYRYSALHEKMCVKVAVKIVRWEHVEVEVEDQHC